MILKNLKNCLGVRLFSSALSVILERERSELPRGSRNFMAILLNEANSTVSRLSSVITGLVPVIWVQQVTNQVNKFAILFKRSMLRQDCRNASGNDGCWKRLFMFFPFLKLLNRIYHPGSSANELTLKAKDDYKSVSQSGRSMIEMLGVLAIIAVLSVGGIAGYSKAMQEYKMNKVLNEYNFLILSLLEHLDDFKRNINIDTNDTYGLVDLATGISAVPPTWKKMNNNIFHDSIGMNVGVYLIKDSGLKMHLLIQWNTADDIMYMQVCRNLLNKTAKPLHNVLERVWFVNGTYYLWGDEFCSKNQTCLKNVSISEIENICNVCSKIHCHINMLI